MSAALPPAFFQRPATTVARDLLGRELVVLHENQPLRVRLTDVEAYMQNDRACHANNNKKTKRNAAMFHAGGVAYLYFVYGMHWVLNFVTGHENVGEAVMVRGAVPWEGQEIISSNRRFGQKIVQPRDVAKWLDGPAKVAQGLGLTGVHNGVVLQPSSGIWLEAGQPVWDEHVRTGPRVGVNYAGEDAFLPWRWRVVQARMTQKHRPKTSP